MPILKQNNNDSIYYQLLDGDETMPYLVFLHEGLGCCEMWKEFPENLCRITGCRGLVYDRIGYGKSSAIKDTRTIHYLHSYALNELPFVLNEIIPNTPFILVGHSDGASISLIFGSKNEKYLQGIISEAAHVMVEDETCKGITDADIAWESGKLSGLYKFHGDKTAQTFKAWSFTWLQPWFKEWSIEYLLPCIEVPILALQGTNDQYASIAQIESIQKLSGGKVHSNMLDNCGHTPHLDANEKVLSLMTAFVKQYASKKNFSPEEVNIR